MSDNQSDAATSPGRDELEETLACVGRINRQFAAMSARLRMGNPDWHEDFNEPEDAVTIAPRY